MSGPFILREHKGPVVLVDNKFSENVAHSGVISIVKTEGIFWAQSNNFEKNAALMGSNAIDLQLGAATVQGSSTVKQCGGVYIDSNTFNLNVGCQDTTGAVAVRCLADDSWTYNSIMDVYSFENGLKMPVFSSNLSYELLLTRVSASSQVQQSLQANYVSVSNNNFSYNFAGTDTAIISIAGFESVVYKNNVHYLNENWIVDTFRLVSQLYR